MVQDNLRQQAYDHVRMKILAQGLTAGQRLAEIPLARELGISRTPVREALNQLAAEGLLERRGWGVTVKQISAAELDEILRLRGLMEPYLAARAARLITPAQLRALTGRFEELHTLYRRMWDAGVSSWHGPLGQRLPIADMLFHIEIFKAARSPRLMRTILDLRLLTVRVRNEVSMQQWNLCRMLREHWRIFRAIRARDPRAARRAMTHHQRQARRLTLRCFQVAQQQGDGPQQAHDWSATLERAMQATTDPRPAQPRRRRATRAHRP